MTQMQASVRGYAKNTDIYFVFLPFRTTESVHAG